MIEQLPWAHQAIVVGDQRPYLTAFVVVEQAWLAGVDAEAVLDPAAHADLYDRLAPELAQINRELEKPERLVLFTLLSRPLDTSVYQVVGPGKVRRDRNRFALIYEAEIARLYSPRLDISSSVQRLTDNRRYRERTHPHTPSIRLHMRRPVRAPVHAETEGTLWSTQAVDLSLGGVLLESAGPAHTGAPIRMTIAGVDAPLTGTVVRVGAQGCAVRFHAMSADANAQLLALLAAD
jgi:hypothetical protein